MHRTRKALGRRAVTTVFALGLIGSSTFAFAQTVVVQGASRVDPDTIRSYFSDGDIREGEKKLKESGLVSSVRATRGSGGQIIVHVTENNNFINRVAFEGNSRVKGDVLVNEVKLRSRGTFSEATAQQDVEMIREIYRRQGRAAAKVSYRTVALSNGKIDVVYTIDEGGKTGVKQINFTGNQVYSTGKLVGMMTTTEMNWFSFFKNTDVYDPDRIASDLELVRRFYLKNGYADFRVISSTANFDANEGGYIINVAVEEGPQFTVASVNVDSRVAELPGQELMSRVRIHDGDVYNGDLVEKTIEALTREVARKGYAFSQVRPQGQRNQADRTVNISFLIEEGPRVYIERINIRGNTRTRDYVIRREFDIGERDAYNRVLIDRAERRLNGLGYFKSVRVTNEPGSAPDLVIVNVDVEDQPTGNFSVSGGYSTSDGFIGEVSVSESNFMGRGQYVRLGGTYGQRTRGLEFSFTEPYFMDYRVAAGFDVYFKQNKQSQYNLYRTTTYGGTLRGAIPLTDELTLAGRYSIFATDLTVPNTYSHPFNDCWFPLIGKTPGSMPGFEATTAFNCSLNGEASVALKGQQGTKITSLFGYTLSYNTLDNAKRPTSGVYAVWNQDVAGAGGDSHYVRTTGEFRYYRELYDDVVGFIKLQGGNILPLKDKLRATDQFNLGPQLVRGFASGGIGPRDMGNFQYPRGNAVGGANYVGATLEAQFPIWGLPRDLGIRGAAFMDTGAIWSYRGHRNFTGWWDAVNYGSNASAWAYGGSGQCVAPLQAPYYGPGSCLNTTSISGYNTDALVMRTSVGGSIIWDSPMGPIRVDLAKAITRARHDVTQVFRFTGGANF